MSVEGRPTIWAGHIGPIRSVDLDRAADFYRRLGLRPAARTEHLRSMELRGGTHLAIVEGEPEPGDVAFDLMVDDVHETRAALRRSGIEVGAVEQAGNHQRIVVVDPDGHRVRIHDSHVIGMV